MKLEKLSTKDWMSPRLKLVDCCVRPLSKSRVKTCCTKCTETFEHVFAELVRIVNRQSKLVEYYHCSKCYRNLEEFKNAARERSIAALPAILDGASKRSKQLWLDQEYRTKCAANTQSLKGNQAFADKISKTLKLKFKTDLEYIEKTTAARKKVWSSDEYRLSRTLTADEFINRAIIIHDNKYDYSMVRYVNHKTKITIICNQHGEFQQRPSHHLHYENGCPKCANELTSSAGESELCNSIIDLGFNVERNRRDILPFEYEIDIFIPQFNLGIEYNGIYFHSFNRQETTHEKYRHHRKSTLSKSIGINLLQFYDKELILKKDIVYSMILNKLGMSNKIHARKCEIVNVSEEQALGFFKNNHLHGYKPATTTIGLVYNNELVSALSFIKRKNNADQHGYEIQRFATKLSCCVVGGLTKMLKYFLSTNTTDFVFTYANRRYSTAIGYLNAGFELTSVTKPDYHYIKNNILYDRHKFQKHKLHALLDNYNEELTESENMFNNGYRRLWGAGHYKLTLKL